MPGFKFNSTIKIVQDKYPNVLFLGVDCDPSDDDNGYAAYTFKNNTTSIKYYEHHSGFFAGYAAVKEGYKKLGFLGGMSVPAVVKYGEGYVAGAEQAAKDMSLADGAVTMPVGMQQKVEILKMLYRKTDILIFDEPTAVLTPQEIDELMDSFRELVKEGKTILFISHKLNEIMLPYIVTLIVLIFTSKHSQAPKAEGTVFDISRRS